MKIFKHLKGFTILMMALLIVFSACQNEDENVSGPSDTLNETNSIDKKNLSKDDFNLDVLAKGLAIVLRDQNNRKILEDELRTSKKVENIIECSEFLEKVKDYTSNGKKSNQTLKKLLKEVLKGKDLREIERTISNLEYGLIDIYMPVNEHLQNWKYTDEILVVPVDNEKAEQEKQIKAYDSELNEINLSTENAPEISCLIITFSEKNGHYEKKTSLEPPTNALRKTTTLTPAIVLQEIRIGIDYDSGWWQGQMEIFIRTKRNSGDWFDSYIINMRHGTDGAINVVGDGDSRWLTWYISGDLIQMKIDEDDDWGSANDDHVADEYWSEAGEMATWNDDYEPETDEFENVRDTGNFNNVLGNLVYRQLVDGTFGGDDYDYIILNYRLVNH